MSIKSKLTCINKRENNCCCNYFGAQNCAPFLCNNLFTFDRFTIDIKHTIKLNYSKSVNLYTVGYEGLNLDCLISKLIQNKINILVDVREYPGSRKPGFSKTPLFLECEKNGISYCHFGHLGTPKKIRDEIRRSGDMIYFKKAYFKHLLGQQESLKAVLDLMVDYTICLMCYERDSNKCHRLFVAEKIKEYKKQYISIVNL